MQSCGCRFAVRSAPPGRAGDGSQSRSGAEIAGESPFFFSPAPRALPFAKFPNATPVPAAPALRCIHTDTAPAHSATRRQDAISSTPGPCTAQRGNLKKASWASLYIHHHLSSHRERHRGRSSSSGPVLVRPRRPAGCCCQDQRGHVLASVVEERRLLHLTRVYLRCDTIIKFIACWRHLPLDPTRRWRHWQRPEVARSSLQCTD